MVALMMKPAAVDVDEDGMQNVTTIYCAEKLRSD